MSLTDGMVFAVAPGREYLLSIRGLGLKSVECIRLLTLHHLAFPVSVAALTPPVIFSEITLQNYLILGPSLHRSKWSLVWQTGLTFSVFTCVPGGYKRGSNMCEARLGAIRAFA